MRRGEDQESQSSLEQAWKRGRQVMRELGRMLYKKRGRVILSFFMNASREMGQTERPGETKRGLEQEEQR